MAQDICVLCGASAYEQKYYLNPAFSRLPQQIRDELKILCVLFTEDIGGVITLFFDRDGNLLLNTSAAEEDILYDDIGCGLKIRQIQNEKRELFEQLEEYYKVIAKGGAGHAAGD